MFEKYTEKARRVIFFARYEASQFGSPFIETEHLLLGLIREDKNLTTRFFPKTSTTIQDIRREIEGRTQVRQKVSTSVDLPFSEESKRVLNFASDESERFSSRHIGVEHILLGLLHEERSVAAEILREHGLRPGMIREELSRGASVKHPQNRSKEPLSLVDFPAI
jgi:ATP-dependent Clp protease ATP-binding subunit ClpC